MTNAKYAAQMETVGMIDCINGHPETRGSLTCAAHELRLSKLNMSTPTGSWRHGFNDDIDLSNRLKGAKNICNVQQLSKQVVGHMFDSKGEKGTQRIALSDGALRLGRGACLSGTPRSFDAGRLVGPISFRNECEGSPPSPVLVIMAKCATADADVKGDTTSGDASRETASPSGCSTAE